MSNQVYVCLNGSVSTTSAVSDVEYIPRSRHGWADVRIADRNTCFFVGRPDNLNHTVEQTILFDDFMKSATGSFLVVIYLTLVSQPFALFNKNWFGGQRHEISLYDKV